MNREAAPAAEATRAPPKKRFFYGWVIVAVVGLVGLVQTGQFNPTIGVFIKPITEEFGWSRATFVGAHTIGTILGGFTAVAVGPALDRWGPRVITSVGFLIIGGGMVGMAFVQNLWQFYLWMILGRVVVQGAVALALNVTVPKWFVRKRGQAMALGNIGTRIGNGTSPLYAQILVTNFGWRTGMFALGVLTWGVALLPSMLFLRRQPEDMGLRPDGDPPERAAEAKPDRPRMKEEATGFTLKEALRSRVFYILLFITCMSMFVGGGVNLNLLAYLGDQGLSSGNAVLVVTTWSIVGTVGTILGGLLADRFPVRRVLAAGFVGSSLGVVALIYTHNLPIAYLYALVFGISFGCVATINQVIYPDYFGRKHIGAIRGFTMPMLMTFNALGPLVAALVFDASDSYQAIFWAFAALYFCSALAMLIAKPPRKKGLTAAEMQRA